MSRDSPIAFAARYTIRTGIDDQFDYDVFISHSSRDREVVHELAGRLQENGLRVWLDDWEIKP
ncbi:MAG: toll/interleukin-1 receptor domain-containing protein [Planctomycetota bacterium]|nr:toll/interleukin-1 receptor domain-containing protein [Planctomycetota bacterium]